MVADPAAPSELRTLGRVLQRLMIGDSRVDLSALPAAWAEESSRTGFPACQTCQRRR